MTALRYRFHASWRGRWRAWRARGVLFGVVAGVVLAILLTAQRTDSAATRFADTSNAFDVYIPNADDEGIARFDPADVAALPNVVDTAVAGLVYIYIGTGETALATEDNGIGRDLNRFDLVEGRPADPTRIDEAVIGVAIADRYGLGVGDTIQLFDPAPVAQVPLPPEEQRAWEHLKEILPDLGIRRGIAASTRVSVVASGAAAAGAPPPVVLGSRLALEAAGAEDAVPVRSTVLAVTMSVLMATAALTLSASLDHLLHDPRSYGLVWTANLTNYGEGSSDARPGRPWWRRRPRWYSPASSPAFRSGSSSGAGPGPFSPARSGWFRCP